LLIALRSSTLYQALAMIRLWRNSLGFLGVLGLLASLGTTAALAQDQDQNVIRSRRLVMMDATIKTKAGQISGDLKKKF
jgi:hypothetical protein